MVCKCIFESKNEENKLALKYRTSLLLTRQMCPMWRDHGPKNKNLDRYFVDHAPFYMVKLITWSSVNLCVWSPLDASASSRNPHNWVATRVKSTPTRTLHWSQMMMQIAIFSSLTECYSSGLQPKCRILHTRRFVSFLFKSSNDNWMIDCCKYLPKLNWRNMHTFDVYEFVIYTHILQVSLLPCM